MKLSPEYELIEVDDFSIECIGESEEWVYDIEVDDNHNFFGNDILLHNSCYVQANANNKFGAIKQGYDLVKLINVEYKKFAEEHGAKECFLEMEFEKAFRKVLFVAKRGEKEVVGAKKRYAYQVFWKDGDFVDGHMEISGFDMIRSDTPRVAKEIQKTVLEMVLEGVDQETVVDFLKHIDKKIRNGEISDEEIGFPKGITENLNNYKAEGPVIRGAIYSNKYLGTRFGKGSKPKFLYIKTVPAGYPDTNVITYEDELPSGFIPDYDMLNERIFEMKLRSIFESIGWKWVDINSNQSTMEAWL